MHNLKCVYLTALKIDLEPVKHFKRMTSSLILIVVIIHSKYFPDSDWHTHNSPKPVSDDQIWKNFVFNEEMTSKTRDYKGDREVIPHIHPIP